MVDNLSVFFGRRTPCYAPKELPDDTSPPHPCTQPLVSIPGIVSPALAHSHRTGAIETGQHMSVSVPLRLHNTADLDAFPAQVSDPMSAQYGHYLTPAQFTERFGPTAAEVTRVSGFLSSAGLHVDSVSGDRQVVVASGTVDQLQKAFNTTLSR